ncbi:unconventional prefoldin RPB5 interactor [Periplaneta americana]|uniref:unconventional prefoldin RPB5 interactor n=1 Tax=Periplaneta americana TaxID=6978 RepID=UPI0037E84F45
MATNVKLKTKLDDPSGLQLLLDQTHKDALQRNEFATRHWMKIRDEHISLHSHLSVLPEKLSQDVMVPIGSRALMRGKMVHTNEILVCLGDGWFVKRSAKEAAEICDRRIKLCENMLKDLEREQKLLSSRKELPLQEDAFGNEGREEILEPCDEQKEAEWREQHRHREKEYRQKLGELRKKEKTTIEDEESLWQRLDELELQEELEEELDRLNAERGGTEYNDDDDDEEEEEEDESNDAEDPANVSDEETVAMEAQLIEDIFAQDQVGGGNGIIRRDVVVRDTGSNSEQPVQNANTANQRSGRRVSFADERTPNVNLDSDSDSDSSTESLRIEFLHTPTDNEAQQSVRSDGHLIQTPADIYKHIKEQMSKDAGPKSILKNKITDIEGSGDTGFQRMQWLNQPDSVPIVTQEMEEPLSDFAARYIVDELEERPMVFGDVLEHPSGSAAPAAEPQTRPTSRFKAARLAAKR